MEETLEIKVDASTLRRYRDDFEKLISSLNSEYSKQQVVLLQFDDNSLEGLIQFRLFNRHQHSLFNFIAILIEAPDFYSLASETHASQGSSTPFRNANEFGTHLNRRYGDSRIYLVLSGFKALLKRLELSKKRKFKIAASTSPTGSQNEDLNKVTKRKKTNDVQAVLDPHAVESSVNNALVELQISHGIDSTFIESSSELTAFVQQTAVSALQFSSKKARLDDELNVLDKKGDAKNPTATLRTQLSFFPNVSSDVAEAIIAQFPTAKDLESAFRAAAVERRADVLANMAVRRGFGVLATERKVGQQTARRIAEFFTIDDPDHLLK